MTREEGESLDDIRLPFITPVIFGNVEVHKQALLADGHSLPILCGEA